MKKINWSLAMKMLSIFLAFSATVAFAQGARVPSKEIGMSAGESYFNSYKFQSGIKSDKMLGTLAKEQSTIGEQASSYGFASKSEEAKFFIIGALYSEAIAFLKSGNLDMAGKRLESIEKEFINLRVPSSLYNFVTKARNLIQTKKYNADVLGDFLSLFQPFYEDYAKSKAEDKLILFRAGSWLVDMSLTAAAGDKELLRQKETLDYFTKEMKRMDAPKGVMDALDEITKISVKKEITDRDAKEVLELVKKIQTVLG
jgi:hypothetical protein